MPKINPGEILRRKAAKVYLTVRKRKRENENSQKQERIKNRSGGKIKGEVERDEGKKRAKLLHQNLLGGLRYVRI